MEIDVACEGVTFPEELIQTVSKQVLSELKQADSQLSVLVCTDAFIRPLNKSYRNKDKPTDVLSFSQREGDFGFAEDSILGDVIVSLDTAKRQAIEKQHSLEKEMCILLIHGILHLLGYDHIEDQEAEIMEAKERELLDQITAKW